MKRRNFLKSICSLLGIGIAPALAAEPIVEESIIKINPTKQLYVFGDVSHECGVMLGDEWHTVAWTTSPSDRLDLSGLVGTTK